MIKIEATGYVPEGEPLSRTLQMGFGFPANIKNQLKGCMWKTVPGLDMVDEEDKFTKRKIVVTIEAEDE
jgi:hypothetical protein